MKLKRRMVLRGSFYKYIPDASCPTMQTYRPFYYIVRDHYSKLLTPFEAIEHPAAFMALMRLDDNFRILSPEGTLINFNNSYNVELYSI